MIAAGNRILTFVNASCHLRFQLPTFIFVIRNQIEYFSSHFEGIRDIESIHFSSSKRCNQRKEKMANVARILAGNVKTIGKPLSIRYVRCFATGE